jgi:voltage-gated potassium channel
VAAGRAGPAVVAAYAWGVLRPDLPGWLLFTLRGIALLGVVTAAVASWFVGRVAEAAQAQDDADDAALRSEVRELAEEVRRLRIELAGRPEAPLTTTGSG